MEQKIIQEVESEWRWQGDQFINNLKAYAARLLGYSIDAELTRQRVDAENVLTQLRHASRRAIADLGPLPYLSAQRELDTFRARHQIERPARIPTKRWTAFGLLTVVVGFESILNGFFFAKGSEFGLVGGIGTAVGISIVNVATAFLLGFTPARWLNHRKILVRIAGIVCAVGGFAAIIALHVFAAHFREASALVGDERAFSVALESTSHTPLDIRDLNSLYLFALGILFAIAAFYKGYTFEDPYPGYGVVSRRADDAGNNYSDEHGLLFDELESIKDEALRSLTDGIERIPLFPQNATNIRAQRTALLQQFKNYESSIETAVNQLLMLYRDSNRVARKTLPPVHFDKQWKLPHSLADSPEVRTLITENSDSSLTSIGSALAELREVARAVLSEYENLRDQYPHPTGIASPNV
jgi:hypothetical protein